VCRLAMAATRELLRGRPIEAEIEDFDAFWADFARYTELRHADGTTVETLLRSAQAELRYDIAQWVADGMPHGLAAYRQLLPVAFEFRLPADSARDLAAAVAVWTTDLKGLSKLVTRIRPEWQVRDCRVAAEICAPEVSLERLGGLAAGA